jgi:hypothetical protein
MVGFAKGNNATDVMLLIAYDDSCSCAYPSTTFVKHPSQPSDRSNASSGALRRIPIKLSAALRATVCAASRPDLVPACWRRRPGRG